MLTSPSDSASTNTGLTSAEAARRLRELGRNELQQQKPPSKWRLLAGQFSSALIWLLLGACVLSIALGEIADAIAIGAIVIANALVGFFQEARAEASLQALRSMTAPRARVVRDGHAVVLPAAEVVEGDLVLLEAGDIVAADGRLLEAHSLAVNEAPLTGESLPVDKTTEPTAPDTPLAEKRDHVFLGTSVSAGTAKARITATGMRTELGKIANLLAGATAGETPLQVRLARVARTLLVACLGIVVVVGILGFMRGERWLDLLLSSVSLAVAAVPEGLPAIVTIALALGVQRLVARHVLVRKLPAVETLGCVTTICTDKTGTLTTGVMAVRELWGPDQHALLFAAAACCDAELAPDGKSGVGDPTEVALLAAAAERGIHRDAIERERPRRAVNPFDSDRKRMSILRADGVLYVKGAYEVIAQRCTSGVEGSAAASSDMASRGLRVLAIASGHGPEEEQLEFLGLTGIADPPRPEAIEAVASAHRAGIRTVMITGDHPVTALAIAREMGIVRQGEDPAGLIHARATAEDKIHIVRELKGKGEIVAMTGDGVNDAPALREAHIGIAMGRGGTEVTREASAMILTDDNFASIVAAIREGRGIYDNIRKTLVFLLACNFGELLVMLGAGILGLPLPLLPIQLLWINLITDGFPALALVTDPPAADLLERPPRRPEEEMLGRQQWSYVVLTGIIEAAVVLGTFLWALRARTELEARTLVFEVIVFSELFRSFAARSETRLFWEVGPLTNLKLLGVALASVVVQVAIARIPLAEHLFQIQHLSLAESLGTLALGLVTVTLLEVFKLVRRTVRGRS